MRTLLKFSLLVTVLLACGVGTAAAAPAGEATAVCVADSVVLAFFTALNEGDAAAATGLFHVTGDAQRDAVQGYVEAGVRFFKTTTLNTRVLETFMVGPYAICAVEQSSAARPELHELQMGCLRQVDDCWRLLPQPQNYLLPVNGLSAQEIATFNVMQNRFAEFKRGYQQYQANNNQRP